MLKNMFRHFFVGLGALGYLLMVPVLLYQYLALMNDWPYLFLSIIYDASGDWWLDVNWQSSALWSTFLCIGVAALGYAYWKRNDYVEYREPEVQSQPGF